MRDSAAASNSNLGDDDDLFYTENQRHGNTHQKSIRKGNMRKGKPPLISKGAATTSFKRDNLPT